MHGAFIYMVQDTMVLTPHCTLPHEFMVWMGYRVAYMIMFDNMFARQRFLPIREAGDFQDMHETEMTCRKM